MFFSRLSLTHHCIIEMCIYIMQIAYKDAIILLQEEIAKDKSKWSYPDVVFGTDLQTEHER